MLSSTYMDIREAGRQGGLARAQKMSKEERSASARKAAIAMHAQRREKKGVIKDSVKDTDHVQ